MRRKLAGFWSGTLAVLGLAIGCERHPHAPAARTEEGPEVRLAGRVLDERGAPLPGALVTGTCSRADDAEHARSSTHAGEHGAFRLDDLPFGAIVLEASCAGHRPARLELGELGPIDEREGLELVLADGATLRGRVRRADGSAAHGARVFLESEDGWAFCEPALDARGAFSARGLGDGPFRVTALADGPVDGEREVASVQGVLPGAHELVLELRRTGALELVLCGTDEPDAAWTTVVDREGFEAAVPWNGSNHELRAAFPAGRLEPGAYWIDASDEEHALAARRRVEVVEGRTTRVELELRPATRLAVRALERGEEVLFDLELRAEDGFVDRSGYRTDVMVGRAVRRVLPPGGYRIEARTEAGSATAEITLAGEPERELVLVLE